MQQRYERNIPSVSEEEQAVLSRKRVLVAGCGGLGGYLLEMLLRAGVGEISAVDADRFEESNLNRQLCALSSTVGKSKVSVMAERLRDINPDIELRCIEGHYEAAGRERFFADYDFAVDCIDLVACKIDLILSCRERGIPVVSALGTGNKSDALQLRLDDISKTYGCTFARVIRKELRERGVAHHPVVYRPEPPLPAAQVEAPPPGRRSVPGSLVWVPATAGMLLCQYVVTELIK